MAVFDVTTNDVQELRELLSSWTIAAEHMCAGELVGGEPLADKNRPPRDSGEAWGYGPNGLTITFGFGKGLFLGDDGADRFGLAHAMPAILAQGVPSFKGDQLREKSTGGDLMIQVCGNDAQVCIHAIRNLTRIAFGVATVRWSQVGYGRTSSTSVEQETPRNLFGFKDGTNNIKAEDARKELDTHVWVQPGDDDASAWMEGGTYLVARKIHMFSEVWDRLSLGEQESVFGRDKRYGAPLSVGEATQPSQEFTKTDFALKGSDGDPRVPIDSHIAVTAPENNDGHRMLRRGYNFTEGNDSLGRLDAGLFFIAFVRDPRAQIYPILERMSKEDALTEYIQHQGSAVFAVPRGIASGETSVAQALFA